jgi:hypothetical protein
MGAVAATPKVDVRVVGAVSTSFSGYRGGLGGWVGVRNRTLTLIEREDDTRSWGNFLVYFSHSTTMSCPPRGWGYILIGC